MKKINYTYIVKCSDGTFYTGWTTDIKRRMEEHNSGKGAKYTRTRIPVELMYYETFSTKEGAMKREYAIKQLTRKEKEELIHANGQAPLSLTSKGQLSCLGSNF